MASTDSTTIASAPAVATAKPSLPPLAPGLGLAAAGSLDWGAPMAHIKKLRKGGAQVLGGRHFVNIHNNQTKFS